MGRPTYSPGLEGVAAGQTAISHLEHQRDALFYRGYDILDLAEKSTYEEVAYLLLKGELPTRAEVATFSKRLIRNRTVPKGLLDLLAHTPRRSHLMDLLRTATSFLGSIDLSADDRNPKALMEKSIRLVAQVPVVVATGYRIAHRMRTFASRSKYNHAKNFLFLLTGRSPQELESRAFDSSLILYAEHGFNASTFAARVTISTLSDLTSAIVAAIGTLKGELHGGANEKAMEMLIEIGNPKKARAWIKKALAQKKRIMGFGHREYRKKDARNAPMKRWALKVSESQDNMLWFDIASEVERTVREEKGLFPNLDFYGAVLYYLLGIPIPLYTPIFAASRVAGWCAHVMEQLEDNRLIRPSSIYAGPSPRPFKILERRLV